MQVVIAHRGARDAYQTAWAAEEAGQLARLVTDLYWSGPKWAEKLLPTRVLDSLRCRMSPGVPSHNTSCCGLSGVVSLALEKLPVPFSWRRAAIRWADANIGRRAGRIATDLHCGLLSYSYYAHSAFREYRGSGPRILFQAHPHPVSVRRILERELALHPDCAQSLSKEWELSLPESDFGRLDEETRMADHWIAASSFTRQTLIENGADARRIHVVPYGVNLDEFCPQPDGGKRAFDGPLRLLFVGSINQRKGIRYLLEALKLLKTDQVELRVCGRVVDDLTLFASSGPRVRITPSVSRGELIEAYRAADLFVFPSVAEGFGQVLLESMACGLPVLSTTSTAAPDLVTEGEQGFVVAPGGAAAIAERLEWCLANRNRLAQMRSFARQRAQQFTWERYRLGISSAIRQCTTGGGMAARPCETTEVQHV